MPEITTLGMQMLGAIRPVESVVRLQISASVTTGSRAMAAAVGLPSKPTGGDVQVFVNGQAVEVGANATLSHAYFSADSGSTAKTLGVGGTLNAGDILYWNGIAAGYQLAATDSVLFIYSY
jgi:hypothetical protein